MITALVVIVYGLIAAYAGFQVCTATHRQRGLDTDGLSILVPNTPGELFDQDA